MKDNYNHYKHIYISPLSLRLSSNNANKNQKSSPYHKKTNLSIQSQQQPQ